MKYDVFISYRTGDGQKTAEAVYNYLQRNGYQCFFDNESIPRGADYDKRILTGVRNSRYFVVVLTKGYFDRCADIGMKENWLLHELTCAEHPGFLCIPPSIVPVAYEEDHITEIPSSIAVFADPHIAHKQIAQLPKEKQYFTPVMDRLVKEALGGWKYRLLGKWLFRWRRYFVLGICGFLFFGLVARSCSGGAKTGVEATRPQAVSDGDAVNAAPATSGTGPAKRQKAGGTKASPTSSAAALAQTRVRTLEQARKELDELKRTNVSHYGNARHDFQSLFTWAKDMRSKARNKVEEQILEAYRKAVVEPLKLMDLGMRSNEIEEARPDLVMAFADIRAKVTAELQGIIDEQDYARALQYYNEAAAAFDACNMRPLDRPDFRPRRDLKPGKPALKNASK